MSKFELYYVLFYDTELKKWRMGNAMDFLGESVWNKEDNQWEEYNEEADQLYEMNYDFLNDTLSSMNEFRLTIDAPE